MEHKQGEPSKDGTTVSPAAEAPVTQGDGASAEKEAKATAEKILKEGPPERALAEASTSAEFQGEANGWDEVKVEAKGEAELHKEGGGKEEITAAPQETADGKEETQLDPKEAKEGQETTPASEKQQADEKQAEPESREEARVSEEAKAEPKQATGEREAETGAEEADGKEGATAASQEEKAGSDLETKAAVEEEEAEAEPQEADVKEAVSQAKEGRQEAPTESGGPQEEQDQGVERESEEGAGVIPSSPEEWLESPKEEDSGLSPGGLGPDTTAASGETSPSASDAPQTPTEPPPSQEKKKEKAPERRVSAPARPRGPRAQNRKAIVDKFGGAASGPTALFRNTKAAGAAIGSVKNMLLEWCRAMTRNYEHVDIQNFSSSWSSGMAFCALIHKFFPDAFDYAALEPSQRRHNLTLAFSTLWLVYTYIQELYRSLVQKGLVKTKKK
uniref:Smoothelin like 1 n=1 Tax=Panthera tigris altaica TaxID=74533 RepID=A0A8C9K0M3_PANTA